jgi:hypothetical protein
MPKLMPTKWSGKEIGVTIGYAVLRKPLTKYGMLKGAAPVEAPKEA